MLPRVVPAWLYKLAWCCNRFGADMRLPLLGAGLRHRLRQLIYSPAASSTLGGEAGQRDVEGFSSSFLSRRSSSRPHGQVTGFSCPMQVGLALVLLGLAGVPGSPLTEWKDEHLITLLAAPGLKEPLLAAAAMIVLLVVSTGLMWLLLAHVINTRIWRQRRICAFAAAHGPQTARDRHP